MKRFSIILATVMALGMVAGLRAYAAAPMPPIPEPIIINFSQCANGAAPSTAVTCTDGWINGILNPNNSHYSEDTVVPQRFVINVPSGADLQHSITFKYQARKGSTHAYD